MQEPRRNPEDFLRKADAAERTRGLLKVFLGYAPGVGKTYSMLSEAIRRKSRGTDVVIGVVETHGRAGTAGVAEQLERVPLRQIDYKGTLFAEMDVDAILARRPKVAIVDELAHTNIEGSRFAKRYEDVFALLEAGIDVLTTVNIQHVESVTPRVQSLTGITVRETVPDWVLDRADEIVMSDLTPEALAQRMRRGDIYPMERVERALSNFFRRGNLIALREMALQRVTRAVDKTLDDYVRLKLDAELFVVHLDTDRDKPEDAARTLEDNLEFAVNLGAKVVHLKGPSVAEATAEFAREQRITQAIFGRQAMTGLKKYLYFREIARFVSAAPHVDLHIVTQETP